MTAASGAGRASWAVFSSAPHRMMFFGGALQLVLSLAFWGMELTVRQTGWWAPAALTLPAFAAHAFLMLYGVFPFFVFGFLMTTYPRWMNGPPVPRRAYAGSFLALAAGVLLFYAGLALHLGVVIAGVVLVLAGWARGLGALLRVHRLAPSGGDRRHEGWLNLALGAGWAGAAAYLGWLATGDPRALSASLATGVWLFLALVFATVCHRMIPFFSYCVLPDYEQVRPTWMLNLTGACLAGLALLQALGAMRWGALLSLPLAVAVFRLVFAWQFRRALSVRLLAVLHLAYAVFGCALALQAAQSLWWLLEGSDPLGRAPLHLLGIGFFAAMVIGMATRVSLGHSGRELAMDRYDWCCFWGVLAAALLRVLGEVPGLQVLLPFNLLAAAAWLLATGAWAWRYLPRYLRPRVDGTPG